MNASYNWKNRLFSGDAEIFAHGMPVGTLKNSCWKQISNGEINGKKCRFVSKGFFKQTTQIMDPDTGREIGNITYHSWKTRAIIRYDNRIYTWKQDNTWGTKWSISNAEGPQIAYQGGCSKGYAELENPDDILFLTGLFLNNYFLQSATSTLMVVLIVIFAM
jgi:hypothetical protein